MPITPNPDANFTPNMKGYSGQQPFRFWCQTVLPLVYDDSLSYYELLNKVVYYLNNAITDISNMGDNVDALLDAYNELQSYVNDYFSTLDVQEEIDSKLDAMAENGTLSALIGPLVPAAVTAWLTENLTPTEPPIDKTLAISDAAADAKVTGDIFRNVDMGTDNELVDINSADLWQQGNIAAGTGITGNNAKRIRTKTYLDPDLKIIKISPTSGYWFALFAYQQDGTYVGAWQEDGTFEASAHTITKGVWVPIDNNYKYKIAIGPVIDGNITPANDYVGVKLLRLTDDTSSMAGKAADAAQLGKAMRYQQVLPENSDLNDIKSIGVWRWSASNVPANSPYENAAGIVVFFGPNNATGTSAQIVISPSNNVYSRYLGSSAWTDWKKLANFSVDDTLAISGDAADAAITGTNFEKSMMYKTTLPANSDLNDLNTIGIWRWTASNVPAHAPYENAAGILMFLGPRNATGVSTQIVTTPFNNFYMLH